MSEQIKNKIGVIITIVMVIIMLKQVGDIMVMNTPSLNSDRLTWEIFLNDCR